MTESPQIRWRVRLRSAPDAVFHLLATDEGRALFWAERTEQHGASIIFHFPNGETLTSQILASNPPTTFALTYFNGSRVTFELRDLSPGTELCLLEAGVPADSLADNQSGWVSVLLNLKAQADHGVDLRSHDSRRTWSDGYVDN